MRLVPLWAPPDDSLLRSLATVGWQRIGNGTGYAGCTHCMGCGGIEASRCLEGPKTALPAPVAGPAPLGDTF